MFLSSNIAAVKAKTREFLNLLLWSADKLVRPTFRNLTDSYESWAYRNGLYRQVATLERERLIEARRSDSQERVYRLTTQGRLQALGGRDPQTRWSRAWDGRWRMVLFDIPVGRDSQRRRLRRYLHERGFGCLQGSVWVTPDPLEEEKKILVGAKVDVGSLLLLDATPCAGESDAEIVACAWNFERINERYSRLMKILRDRPTGPLHNEAAAKALLRWASAECEAWWEAVRHDPLLPQRILPPGYLGQTAWQRRVEALRQARAQMRTFAPP
ncbi:MAG TPA: PaaX family transcriptional regulator C-terminal domain-containing protein [Methylomirabilota bacterium]|nr:PaaX family transcriptional regulator C-terminal domain-containing protein [Methylomirabilota bacterium]